MTWSIPKVIHRLFHRECESSRDLRRAVELHKYSTNAIAQEAPKQSRRNSDIRITVEAALRELNGHQQHAKGVGMGRDDVQ